MAAATVTWSADAIADLKNIADYIAIDSPQNADRLIVKILKAVEHLTMFPRIGRRTPERDDDHYRELIERPFRIWYRIDTDQVVILNVFHGARNIGNSIE